MKIGIDIDNTITANPIFFKNLIEVNLAMGNEIHIITGGLEDSVGYEYSPSSRIEQLKNIGISEWTTLVRCFAPTSDEVARLKGNYCKNTLIDCMYEDTVKYIETIKQISPKTQTFLIM